MKTNRTDRMPHDREWQLQEAKNRLSQVVDSALLDGPQTITLRGKPAAVVVAYDEFRKLAMPRTGLTQFFRLSPMHGVEIEVCRCTDPAYEVEL
jgi:prevent-host-death family protein